MQNIELRVIKVIKIVVLSEKKRQIFFTKSIEAIFPCVWAICGKLAIFITCNHRYLDFPMEQQITEVPIMFYRKKIFNIGYGREF